jgi:hypothetical protein
MPYHQVEVIECRNRIEIKSICMITRSLIESSDGTIGETESLDTHAIAIISIHRHRLGDYLHIDLAMLNPLR